DPGVFAVSPDGKTIATAADDGVVLWETTTGNARHHLVGPGPANAVAFAPDGRTLAAGEAGRVRLWDVDGGRPAGELPIAPLGRYPGVRLVFSPDGKALAAGHRLGAEALPVVVWDIAVRRELRRHGG